MPRSPHCTPGTRRSWDHGRGTGSASAPGSMDTPQLCGWGHHKGASPGLDPTWEVGGDRGRDGKAEHLRLKQRGFCSGKGQNPPDSGPAWEPVGVCHRAPRAPPGGLRLTSKSKGRFQGLFCQEQHHQFHLPEAVGQRASQSQEPRRWPRVPWESGEAAGARPVGRAEPIRPCGGRTWLSCCQGRLHSRTAQMLCSPQPWGPAGQEGPSPKHRW